MAAKTLAKPTTRRGAARRGPRRNGSRSTVEARSASTGPSLGAGTLPGESGASSVDWTPGVGEGPALDRPPAPIQSLDPSKSLFIRRWGEMGGYWGISRTMAEIHALLYISTDPVCTDDVMRLLAVSRGNASMNLRSLLDWGLIHRVHIRGDRKEYFTAQTDVWHMFETIIRQRRRREVEPILETIRRCREMARQEVAALAGDRKTVAEAYLARLDEMNTFLTAVSTMVDLLLSVGPKGLDQVSGLAARFAK